MNTLQNIIISSVPPAITLVLGWFVGRKKTSAEVQSLELDNTEKILKTHEDFIIKPLKSEIHELRTEIQHLKEVIYAINDCPNYNDCPAKEKLKNKRKNEKV